MEGRAAAYWDQSEEWSDARGIAWLEIPAVRERLNVKISGSPTEDWLAYTVRSYLEGKKPLSRCLSLCCGKGGGGTRLGRQGSFLLL